MNTQFFSNQTHLNSSVFQQNTNEIEIENLKRELNFAQTKLNKVQEELDFERNTFRQILNALPIAIWIKDTENNMVYCNQNAADVSGLTIEEIQGKSTYELYPEHAAKYHVDDLKVINSGEAIRGIIEHILDTDGNLKWVRTDKHPWKKINNEIAGIVVTATDITEIVRQKDNTNNLMVSVAKALEQSEERYYLAIRGSNDGIWDWDLVTNEVFYSPRYIELLGYRVDEFPNVFDSFKSHVYPEDFSLVMEKVKAHLEQRIPYEAEFRMRHKNGNWIWFSARGQAIWDKDGIPYRMSGSQRDITDRKQAEQNVSEFFSTVSHELRTPLTAIKGSLQLVQAGLVGEISNDSRELIDIASSSCERLIRLVNDILDLRKIEAGKLDLQIQSVNTLKIADNLVHTLKVVAQQKNVVLVQGKILEKNLKADQDRLIQVLTNLIGNAIKFSDSGSQVTLSIESIEELWVRFIVSDNGPGIPLNKQHLLFNRFKQLDSSDTRRQEGTGLGLAICKAIVLQHKGRIGVESKEGEGSSFWFDLPV